jgi:hypothetical protein
VNSKVTTPLRTQTLDEELFSPDSNDDQPLDADELEAGNKIPESQRWLSAVTGIACQGYNKMVHRTCGNSGEQHDAQIGLVTSALTGSYATTDKIKCVHDMLRLRCAKNWLHERFANKIQTTSAMNHDLRLENIFCIDLCRLHSDACNGR